MSGLGLKIAGGIDFILPFYRKITIISKNMLKYKPIFEVKLATFNY